MSNDPANSLAFKIAQYTTTNWNYQNLQALQLQLQSCLPLQTNHSLSPSDQSIHPHKHLHKPILRLRRIRRILSNLNHVKKKIYLGRTTFHRTADPTLTLILDQSKAASAQIY